MNEAEIDLLTHLHNGGDSKDYDGEAIERLSDYIVTLPDNLAFPLLKDLALNADINNRMFLRRADIFDILKRGRCIQ